MVRNKIRVSKADLIADICIYTIIVLLSVSIIYPVYYLLINSFNATLAYGPAFLLPKGFTLANYNAIFHDKIILNAFTITILRTAAGIFMTVFCCSMCGFALRKKGLSFRNIYLVIFTIPMFFGGGIIPTYMNYRMLGLLDNFLVYILRFMFAFFYVIIFMSSFNDIPESLEESAKIDGAGYFRIFLGIYIPISLPVIATISLFVGVAQWNSWYDTIYFTSSPKLMTLAGHLLKIIKESNLAGYSSEMSKSSTASSLSPEGIKFATMLVAILPITMFYPFLQRYFIKGVMIGAVKG